MSVVAGFVVETIPGAAPRVAERLASLPGITVEGGDGDCRLAVVWIARNGGSMGELAERLLEVDPELIGIYPAYISDIWEDEAGMTPWRWDGDVGGGDSPGGAHGGAGHAG